MQSTALRVSPVGNTTFNTATLLPADKAADVAPVVLPAPTERAEPVTKEVVRTNANVEASFEYDQQLKEIIITLRRDDNGQVVQQIPAEQIRNLILSLREMVEKAFDGRG